MEVSEDIGKIFSHTYASDLITVILTARTRVETTTNRILREMFSSPNTFNEQTNQSTSESMDERINQE